MKSLDVLYETQRLKLRGLSRADIDGPYLGWFNDQEVCRYNSHGRFPATRDKMMAYLDMLQTSEQHLVLAVIDKVSGVHIGNISLQSIDLHNKTAEFAIIMGDRNYWGKGYAYEASRQLLEHGFLKLGLNRIYCGTSENNTGMRKLADKLGMQQEGCRRQAIFENGKFVDVIEFGILFEEYKTVNG